MSQRLLTQATIATFLAAVQAQTLAIYFNDDTTALQIVTNAFTFAGVFLDVIAGFISLLSSAMLATQVANVNLLHDLVSGCSRRYLDHALEDRVFNELGFIKSPIGRWMCWQVNFFSEQQPRNIETDAGTDGPVNDRFIIIPPEDLIGHVDRLGQFIELLMLAGNAAAAAMLLGIFCFLTSIVCFAFATQPRAVQLVSVLVLWVCSVPGWVVFYKMVARSTFRRPKEIHQPQEMEHGTPFLRSHKKDNDDIILVAFSPDGRRIAYGHHDGSAQVRDAVWDMHWSEGVGHTQSDTPLGGPFDRHIKKVTSIAFSPDGLYIVSGSDDQTARVWVTEKGKERCHRRHAGPVTSVAFSPDGHYIVSGSEDGIACVWNAKTGLDMSSSRSAGPVTSVAFSQDGSCIVAGTEYGTVDVWSVESGIQVGESFTPHSDRVTSVAFSPDGHYIVSGSDDQAVRVWVAEKGEERCYSKHDGPVTSVAFSPDGCYVVSGSKDGTARVWDAETGKEMWSSRHTGTVTLVAFSPDGRRIVSGSDSGTTRVLDAEKGGPLLFGSAGFH